MIRTGGKTIAGPAINRFATITIRTTKHLVSASKLSDWEPRVTRPQLGLGLYRKQSSFGGRRNNDHQSERVAGTRTKSRPSSVNLNLKDARTSMDEILSRLSKLDLPSPSLSAQNNPNTIPAGKVQADEMVLVSVLEDTRELYHALIVAVENGQLNPSGKHGKELSNLMEVVLYAYSRIDLPDTPTFEYCEEALSTLKNWNLDIHSKHSAYTIAVANREERWKDASSLFWKQINPEAGFNPVNVSISNPLGLYAIARLAQEENSAVAEHVFDAVQQLTMVSPRDQRTYLLAAGTALGHAGEWESAVEYLRTSYTASQLGQPLIASVMQACLLSGRPAEALEVYESSFGDQSNIAAEWQWGGERDRLDPLCRDLSMRAMKSRGGMAPSALQFFHQSQEEGVTISLEALQGVVEACEEDNDVEGAVSVLLTILENTDKNNWIVSGSELWIDDCDSDAAAHFSGGSVSQRWLPEMADILTSIMRTCNSKSNFGTSLFCMRLLDLNLAATKRQSDFVDRAVDSNLSIEQSIVPLLSKIKQSEDLLAAAMVSLCGLRCSNDAIRLFDVVQDSQTFKNVPFDARIAYGYAVSENNKHGPIRIGNPWMSADRHIHRLTAAVHTIRKSGRELIATDANLIQGALAAAMHSCTNAHQPELSLRLLSWVENNLAFSSLESSTGNKMKSYLGIDEMTVEKKDYSMSHDRLTSEIINAHRWNRDLTGAVGLFQLLLDSKVEELDKWRLSCAAGLSALIANGRGNDALEIFKAMDQAALSNDSYCTLARFLSKETNGQELGDLYRSAVNHGYLSEDLSLLAMTAVASSKVDNRLRILRAIVNDNARGVGMDPTSWMHSRYWNVKRALGFDYARLLMWWNDPETCHLDELELAIQEFGERRTSGLKAKHDAVRVIVGNAKYFDEKQIPTEPQNWKLVPFTTNGWNELLQEVLNESRSSSKYYDAIFIDDVVEAFRNLNCNRECVEFMTDVLGHGIRVNKKALSESLEAAKEEQSIDLANEIQMLIS